MTKRWSRRAFLRGAGGVAVALPALEIMGPGRLVIGSAAADAGSAPPCRFVTSYGGISFSDRLELFVPATTGPAWESTRALAPIHAHGVQDDVTVVSNLKVPWVTSGEPGPGERSQFFHYNTVGPQIAGTRTAADRGGTPRGPTADQIVADAIAADTRFRMLPYRIQPAHYVGRNELNGRSGRFSWRREADGTLSSVEPIVSPRSAYESLFTGFTPTDPAAAERARQLLGRRKSALDFVRERANRLMSQVGTTDRRRLERHFDEVRALELRLDEVEVTGGICRLPEHPGDDPPIGGYFRRENSMTYYSTSQGYSGEDERGEILTDLIAMAFACDLTRAVSFMQTEWKCYMNMFQIAGHQEDVHGTTHSGDREAVADAVAWHVEQFARLTRKLKEMPEVDGTTVLDHTAMVMLFEGGNGHDPEGSREGSSHSTENMIVIAAGRAGGMQAGLHIDGGEAHPASVVLSAMRSVGVSAPLGDIDTPFSPLMG